MVPPPHAHWFAFQSSLIASGLLSESAAAVLSETLRGPYEPSSAQLERFPGRKIQCLIVQGWYLLNYQWQAVIDANAMWLEADDEMLPEEVSLEQKFITLVAHSYLDQGVLELRYQSELAHDISRLHLHHITLGYIVEKAAIQMSHGLYREALRILEAASALVAKEDIAATYWLLRHEIILGICKEATGLYAESAVHLANQKKLLQENPQPVLSLAYARRQLSHHIESEELALADDFRESIGNSIEELNNPALKAMYLTECLRLHLEMGRVKEAEECFDAQESIAREGKIPKSFMLLSYERCELALLKHAPERAAQIIISELWSIQKSGSPNSQALAMFALARAHALAGNHDSAFQNGELALLFCQKYSFGRTTVRIMFLLISMAHRLGKSAKVIQYLRMAERELEKMPLSLHRDLLLVLRWRFDEREIDWTRQNGRFLNAAELHVLREWSRYYLFDGAEFSLLEIITKLTAGMVGATASRGALLYWKNGEGLGASDLSDQKLTSKLVQFLLKRTIQGANIEEIHSHLWRGSEYRSDRHGARIHSLIKSTRHYLQRSGLGIEFKKDKYRLEPSHRLFQLNQSVLSHRTVRTRKRRALPKYRDAILHALKEQPMSGTQLADYLQITPQSLHPVLKELEKAGLVRFVKQGRYSRYHLE